MKRFAIRLLSMTLALLIASTSFAEEKIKALILDGQNNHNWKGTTPILKKILEDTGKFSVEVATSPQRAPKLQPSDPSFPTIKL